MDWSKAKSIIIAALILTNAFLIYTYAVKPLGGNGSEDEGALLELLSKKGIALSCEIPKAHQDAAAIAALRISENLANAGEEHRRAAAACTVENYESATDGAYANAAERFMQELGISMEYAFLREIKRNEGSETVSLIYGASADGIEISGNSFECVFREGRLRDYGVSWLEPQEFSHGKRPTISAYIALMEFVAERPEGNCEISDMRLVYRLDEDEYSSDSALTDTIFVNWAIEYSLPGGTEKRYGFIPAQEQN